MSGHTHLVQPLSGDAAGQRGRKGDDIQRKEDSPTELMSRLWPPWPRGAVPPRRCLTLGIPVRTGTGGHSLVIQRNFCTATYIDNAPVPDPNTGACSIYTNNAPVPDPNTAPLSIYTDSNLYTQITLSVHTDHASVPGP